MAFLNYTGLQRFLAKLKTIFVGDIAYDATGKALTKTVNGVASDIVSTAALKRDMNLSKSDVGLDNVDNKSSATIREEITKKNVTDALGTGAGTVKYLREDGEWGTPISSLNGEVADENGNYELSRVPFADNLTADDAQSSFGEFIARTTGGDASLSDGDAWLSTLKGRRIHTGYAAANVAMTVTPVTRVAPADITAVINETTFKTEVDGAYGNYRFSYTGFAWTLPTEGEENGETVVTNAEVDLADYGITVSNTPIPGDNILVADAAWRYQENTINAAHYTGDEITSGVPVLFHHMLSRVGINVSTAYLTDPDNSAVTYSVIIQSISLNSVYNQGTMTLTNSDPGTMATTRAWTPANTTYFWSQQGNPGTIAMTASTLTTTPAAALAQRSVLPQPLNETSVDLTYTVVTYSNGTEIIREYDIPASVKLNTIKDSSNIAITQWLPNRIYTYNIIIDPRGNEIRLAPVVESDWSVIGLSATVE